MKDQKNNQTHDTSILDYKRATTLDRSMEVGTEHKLKTIYFRTEIRKACLNSWEHLTKLVVVKLVNSSIVII